MNIWWKAFLQRLRDMKYQRKITLAFMLISMIPVTLLGGLCFQQTKSLLITQSKASLKSSLQQSTITLNNQLDAYNKMIGYLSFNQEIVSATYREYTGAYEIYNQLNNVIDQIFIMSRYLNSNVEQITLYTENNIYPHGNTVKNIEEIQCSDWYDHVMDTMDAVWVCDGTEVFCSQQILKPSEKNLKANVLQVKVNYDTLFLPLEIQKTQGISVFAVDALGNLLFTSGEENQLPISSLIQIEGETLNYKGKEYTILCSELPSCGWKIFLCKPTGLIVRSANRIILKVLLMMGGCIVLLIVVSKLFSQRMVSRIECLRKNMKDVENGQLEVTVVSNSQDEVGDLIHGFGKMVEQIRHLIDEVYVAEIARKEYEMKALQAQINPHFLYNSLSLINWRALKIHAEDISEMAQLLSTFYRTTLNKGSNMTTVANELLNVQSYIKIEQIMHSYSFDMIYQIDETIYQNSMPNLMLQPLLENAIIHGIENKEDGLGQILLIGKIENGCLVFQINDNGVGIASEQLITLLQEQSKGYGIKNVNDRAKLMYGEMYGLSVKSIAGSGTQVTLCIPQSESNVK